MKLTEDELRDLRNKYNIQKKSQKRRGPDRQGHQIRVTMTFEEWLSIWVASGKLHLRGRAPGKYVMGRKDDLGDYAVGNVEIILHEENCAAAK